MLKITLFGVPQLEIEGVPCSDAVTGREMALLSYLAVTGKVSNRSTLVDLLWHDATEQQARKNLRNLLYNLRQQLDPYLEITRQTIALTRNYWLDVESFCSYWATQESDDDRSTLTEILALYQGDFLQGFSIQEAPLYDAWLVAQRRTLQEQAIHGLDLLAEHHLSRDNYERGLLATRQLLALAPWHENAHRQQMLLLARAGHRSAALAQYTLCQQALAEEYGVAPLPETTALYMQLKSKSLARAGKETAPPEVAHAPHQQQDQPTSPQALAPIHGLSNSSSLPRINWDTIPTAPRLYGRETELRQLEGWALADHCQVIALFGFSGQGKTALAAELVHRLVDQGEQAILQKREPAFTQIIWTTVLGDSSLAQILAQWITQLSTPHTAPQRNESTALQTNPLPSLELLLAQLIHCLRARRSLLILDQAEHLWRNAAQTAAEESTLALLLQWLAEGRHQSCLLFSSAEQPQSFMRLARYSSAVRTLYLTGLATAAGVELLRRRGLDQSSLDLLSLTTRYGGNPLALTLLAEMAYSFSLPALALILQQEILLFDDLQRRLKEQFHQLPALAQEMVIWIAIEQSPVTVEVLWEYFLATHSASALMSAYRRLQQSLLIEQRVHQEAEEGEHIHLPAIFAAYAIHHLVNQVTEELNSQLQSFAPTYLNKYLLFNAHHASAIQKAQQQFILRPILKQLISSWGRESLSRRLQDLLSTLDSYPIPVNRHAKTNLRTLLAMLAPKPRLANNGYLPTGQLR